MLQRIFLFLFLFAAGCEHSVRFATCSAPLSRDKAGKLLLDLSDTGDPQIKSVADAIEHVDPDVLLLSDIDHDIHGAARYLLAKNYLSIPQSGAPSVKFAYFFNGPVNTGVASGYDLDGDGKVAMSPGSAQYSGDAIGPGLFPGQHGMTLLSKYPIDTKSVRTFSRFKWKNMPGAQLPTDAAGKPRYSDEMLGVLRLASTSFWDVPIQVDRKTVHLLISRPDVKNPNRSHDEIRFWADYLGGRGKYMVDDANLRGGSEATGGKWFVIMGQENSPALEQLLKHPAISPQRPSTQPSVLVSKYSAIAGGGITEPRLTWVQVKY